MKLLPFRFGLNRRNPLILCQQEFDKRIKTMPDLRPQCEIVKKRLQSFETSEEALKNSADIYTDIRGGSAMFVEYTPLLDLEPYSKSGLFKGSSGHYFTGEWASTALAKPMTRSRLSVHFLNIRGRYQYYAEHGDKGEFDTGTDIWWGFPDCLKGHGGAVLLTPLGLERMDIPGHGFIYEHREESPSTINSVVFNMKFIREARTLSSCFVLLLVEMVVAENPGLFETK